MCPQTTNKGFEVQTTGSNTGTWGTVLNDQMISYADQNLGGLTTLSLSASPVTLSATQSRNAILRLTGTLLASVQITTECIGFFFVENLTTGSFAVTIRNTSVSTAATIPQSLRSTVISDTTNGCRTVSDSVGSGTRQSFNQTAAPTGWTKESVSTYNDAAIRLTTGTVSTGGSKVFSDTFTSRPILQANIPSYTLPDTISISGSPTNLTRNLTPSEIARGISNPQGECWGDNTSFGETDLGISGSVTSGGSGTPMDFAVKFVDFIIATRG
jgi:hypothetical protein